MVLSLYLRKKVLKVVILVTNDIETDQRVARMAGSISSMGYAVTIVGRKLPSSKKKLDLIYSTFRFRLPINHGPLFYLSYNVWAFFFLLFRRFSVIVACDTDTLIAGRTIRLLKPSWLVFDAHELFTEMPELVDGKHRFARWTWKLVENACISGCDLALTVSESIALEYEKRYGKTFIVLRNLPYSRAIPAVPNKHKRPLIIYQGAINLGRGLELLCESMKLIPEADLWIAGTGDLERSIKELAAPLIAKGQVRFLGRVVPDVLYTITTEAMVGVSLEEDLGLSYRYALPNKLFDYIAAGIPVLVSNLPEMKKMVDDYGVGLVLSERTPQSLANALRTMITNEALRTQWLKNIGQAALKLTWNLEQEKLFRVWKKVD
jgi:Glycosyltransferase